MCVLRAGLGGQERSLSVAARLYGIKTRHLTARSRACSHIYSARRIVRAPNQNVVQALHSSTQTHTMFHPLGIPGLCWLLRHNRLSLFSARRSHGVHTRGVCWRVACGLCLRVCWLKHFAQVIAESQIYAHHTLETPAHTQAAHKRAEREVRRP